MLLSDKNVIIYGGSGAIGGAVAQAFIREGAKVYLVGRTLAKLERIAAEITAAEGKVDIAQVDALDVHSVEQHANAVMEKAGSIDIALNAVGVPHIQGTPLAELSLEDFEYPVQVYTRTNFITSKVVARHMVKKQSGVILMLSTPASQMPGPGFMGHSTACAGVEAMSRHLAGELGASGIRVNCIRSHMIPEAARQGSHSRVCFGQVAERAGITLEEMLTGAAGGTLLKRLPTLADVANTAVYLASDYANAMTGTIANLTCGVTLD